MKKRWRVIIVWCSSGIQEDAERLSVQADTGFIEIDPIQIEYVE